MKNKKIIGIIIAIIVVIIIIIGGSIIYNKKQKNNITNENTKIAVKKHEVKVNQITTMQKPKMLTEKEQIKENSDKKYVTLEEAEDYIAAKSTALLIKEFPNEKGNGDVLNNKIRAILKTTMTEKVMKDKFYLNGPKYDLNQFDVEITPIDDCKFAFNINTDNLIDNSNKDICISRTFSAE